MSYTTLFRSKIPRDARNAHLHTEVEKTIKRTLTGAQNEMKEAIRALNTNVEYYSILTSGKKCTCSLSDKEVSKEIEEGTSLTDFLLQIENNDTKDFCPVCFGTTFTGGYKRSGCNTLILDATDYKLHKTNLIRESPFWFKALNGYVEWVVDLPTYFNKVENIAIRWKEKPYTHSFTINDEEVTKETIKTYAGSTVSFKLHMKDTSNPNAGVYCIFIQLQLTNKALIPCDMPNTTISYTGAWNVVDDPQDSITINFDSSVTPSTRDLIVNPYTKRAYRIVECEKGTSILPIFNTCTARLVREFEKYYFLPTTLLQRAFTDNPYTFI